MSLRFTDTNKWRDAWFMDLSVMLKTLWVYVCDNCDNAGVWPVNSRLAEFEIGQAIDWDKAVDAFTERVVLLDDGRKWHLTKFVSFQNPGGLGDSHPHKQILRLLSSHGLPSPLERVVGRLPEGYEGASQTRLDQTIPDEGGCKGGGAIRLKPILAEFGIATPDESFAEWKHGIAKEAKCRSADEARAFLRWAITVCASEDLKVKYWRHVKNLAHEWDSKYRATHWKAA